MLYSRWLSLSVSTRQKIAEIFNIPKTGSTHVVDNRIESDGYNVQALEEKLSKEAMQKYLVLDEQDKDKLFEILVECIENPLPKGVKLEVPIIIPAEIVPIIEEKIKKHRGRIKGSKNKKK